VSTTWLDRNLPEHFDPDHLGPRFDPEHLRFRPDPADLERLRAAVDEVTEQWAEIGREIARAAAPAAEALREIGRQLADAGVVETPLPKDSWAGAPQRPRIVPSPGDS
jgi:hypothetical protein